METSVHKRRRVLFHFLLGIGLPSVLLGYLAFRGIRNDMALLERERVREHNTVAQEIAKSIDDEIAAIEKALLDATANQQAAQGGVVALDSLERLRRREPLIEEVFSLEDSEDIHFPLARLLFCSGHSADASSPSLQSSALSLGQRQEFQQRRYREALASYRQALAQAASYELKGEALNAIARVQKKASLFTDAIESYEAIGRDYADIRTAGGAPAGLAARLELAALFVAIDDPNRAVQTLFHVYEDLIHAKWTLDTAEYEFFVRQLEASVDEILLQDGFSPSFEDDFRALRKEERQRRESTERLLSFQQNAAPNLLSRASRGMENTRTTPRRFTLDIGRHTYLVSLLDNDESGEHTSKSWGLLFDSGRFHGDLLLPRIRQYTGSQNILYRQQISSVLS